MNKSDIFLIQYTEINSLGEKTLKINLEDSEFVDCQLINTGSIVTYQIPRVILVLKSIKLDKLKMADSSIFINEKLVFIQNYVSLSINQLDITNSEFTNLASFF